MTDKAMLIDAICGASYSMDLMIKFTKLGYAEFCGNQHNENWRFVRVKLETLSVADLEKLYARHA